MVDIQNINQGIMNKFSNFFSGTDFASIFGWFLLVLIIALLGGYFIWWYWQNKQFKKRITAFEIINNAFTPSMRDRAKVVKLGKGGFEVLYLRKLKTYKLVYGGRIGKEDYYFFVDRLGYWYNGLLSADIFEIDKRGGLIPVIATSPTMRAQYTALEKQIDSLHTERKSFMEKYGVWVFGITYLAIIGVFSWLSFREIGQFLGQGSELAKRMTELAEVMNKLAVNMAGTRPSGLEG